MTEPVAPVGTDGAGLSIRKERVGSKWLLLIKPAKGKIGFSLLAAFIVLAVAAPLIAPHDPLQIFSGHELASPSSRFLLGTDELGRDLLSRIIFGAGPSLLVALLAITVAAVLGIPSGLISGYLGGRLDSVVMRFWDSILAIPTVLIGIIVAAFFGGGTIKIAIALGLGLSPSLARVARAAAVQERNKEYVTAATLSGVRAPTMLVRHILPNAMGPILIQMALSAGIAVLIEAALSYIGLGTRPPTASWGTMIQGGQSYMPEAYWYWAPPGIAVALLVVGLNFIADVLRDVYDPQTPVNVGGWS